MDPLLRILHVDMDAFFASVEQRDHPEYQGKPLIVGAPPDVRGVVSTCSYEARKFGVHSAMPSREAYRLCPSGIFVQPDMQRYMEASNAVFEIFRSYTPMVQGLSCDEAFLDVAGAHLLFGDAVTIAKRIQSDIATKLSLTASVGVAPNKFLAKLCSDLNKPNGLTVSPTDPTEIAHFLAPMSVGRIFGVGKVLSETLRQHNVKTIGDLQRAHITTLTRWVGQNAATSLKQLAFGIDDRQIETEHVEKSISREYTFDTDQSELELVRLKLLELASDVARQVRAAGKWAATAHLKLRTSDFATRTRQRPLQLPSQDDFAFRTAALELFKAEPIFSPVRLIGFGVSSFTTAPPPPQPTLFGPDLDNEKARKREALSRAIDSVNISFATDKPLKRKPTAPLDFEDEWWAENPGAILAGVDEAGRGPLAGPVVAGAVSIAPELAHKLQNGALRGITDSKKLTEHQREELFEELTHTDGVIWAAGHSSAEEIDQLNILRATHLAMKRALETLSCGVPAFALVDGLSVRGLPCPHKPIVKGDAKSFLIAAASIIAKVTRDRIMRELDSQYPGYGLAIHKGYPVPAHINAIRRLGILPIHRRSFGPVAEILNPPML